MSSIVEIAAEIRPFHVDVPDEALEDLRRRIEAIDGRRRRRSRMNRKAFSSR